MAAAASTTIPATAKSKTPDEVIVILTVRWPAKQDPTLADLKAEPEKVLALAEEAKKFGTITGHALIGKKKYSLAQK